MQNISLVTFDRSFLEKSRLWLRDPEIKKLTMAPDFTNEEQELFFASLPEKTDYLIFGLILNAKIPLGVLGLKNIKKDSAEYWGYIGEKQYWGKGIGRQMLALAEKKALTIGISRLWLKVVEFNDRAIRLYEKNDYCFVKKEDDLLIYEKKIKKDDEA